MVLGLWVFLGLVVVGCWLLVVIVVVVVVAVAAAAATTFLFTCYFN